MPGELALRPATLVDRPAIDAFARVVIPEVYTRLAGPDYADEVLRSWWGPTLDPDIADGRVTVAIEAERGGRGGRIVGLAHVGSLDGTPVLWKLYVDPERRSAGIGARLVDRVVAELPVGTGRLLVEHIAANVDAARFYRRHEFERTHVDSDDDHRLATVWRQRRIDRAGHDHGHRHDEFDWAAMVEHLAGWDRAFAGVYDDIAAWLAVQPGMCVVDVGSGAGGFAAALARRVVPGGGVVLIDGDVDLLAFARRQQPAQVDVTTVCVDLDREPIPNELVGVCDLVHASGVVHHTDDQVGTIRKLTALLSPGGRLVLGEGGLATRFLPSECGVGEPDLEARLHAATIDWFWTEVRPSAATTATDEGWGALLERAGLHDIGTRSFLLDIAPPLNADQRQLVASTLAGAADRVGRRLAADDRAAIDALVDPARRTGIYHRPDVFILTARTLHVGTRPA
jgi:SAM-dependent methyltransferase/GNAT superfamily N-acetyltransferase